ncbi:Inner membrane protein YiaV precursor [Rubripirellula lacrimiformis]|uniref:Inner membrane protein YiaV n=1 Tax=Rubripirellula lacrimiformis TaxID=1930273 RepID=A0A517N634_9BACT|nr:biotin/lipoyl-binding protein [Rubripirellula lacrimiformis]QDT02468.1 Inner membrane protein YiaV precursor [Rubripirellula lacrimiformis]
MMWILSGIYCFGLWLVFAKLKLLRLSLPIAIVAGSIGPALIVALLFYHPRTTNVVVIQQVVPLTPQLTRAGRVTKVAVQPNVPIRKGDVLFEVDRTPYENTVARLTDSVNEAEGGVKVAQSAVQVAAASIQRAQADFEFATNQRDRQQKLMDASAGSEAQLDQAVASYAQATAALDQANTTSQQTELSVAVAQTQLGQARIALAEAKYDLEQTTVVAPSDGFVTNLQLREGALIGGPGAQPVMSFIPERKGSDLGVVVAMFGQRNYLLIKPKQYAEVVLDAYPGQVFTGRVMTTIDTSGTGQLQASGDLPDEIGSGKASAFAVRIALDDGQSLRLPGGAVGSAAVYTDHVQVAGIPVMFVMRMESWINYVF